MGLREGVTRLAAIIVIGGLASCSDEQTSTNEPTKPAPKVFTYNSAPVLQHYLALGDEAYANTLQSTLALSTAISNLLTTPTKEHLVLTRKAWQLAHNDYQGTQVFNFRNRLNPLGGKDLSYAIDGWPIQPGLIDYVQDYPYSGFIHHPSLVINEDNLRSQNGATDAEEISIGFHAMEFMLWGDQTDKPRPVTDFESISELSAEQKGQGFKVADMSNNRRRLYLATMMQALQQDIDLAAKQWTPNQPFYQQHLFKLDNKKQFSLILRSVYGWVSDYLIAKHLNPMNQDLTNQESVSLHAKYSGTGKHGLATSLSNVLKLYTSPEDGIKQGVDAIIEQLSKQQAQTLLSSLTTLDLHLTAIAETNKDEKTLAKAQAAALQLQNTLMDIGRSLQISLNAQQMAASH